MFRDFLILRRNVHLTRTTVFIKFYFRLSSVVPARNDCITELQNFAPILQVEY